MLSRLQARDILRVYDPAVHPDVDPDTVMILRQIAGLASAPVPGPTAPPNAPPGTMPASQSQDAATASQPAKDSESWKLKYDPSWMAQINPVTGLPWFTPADVEHVNRDRAMGLAAGEAMAKEIPYTLATPPERTSPGILFTNIGHRNRANDVCIAYVDTVTGARYTSDDAVPTHARSQLHSVFKCGRNEMHGYYADENENRIGCAQCFVAGGGDTGEREDSGGSDREESF
jgi:hypothetical protein